MPERHAVLLDPAERDQLGAQLVGQPGGGGVGADDDQRVAAGEGVGQPGAAGGLLGLLDGAGVDQAAVLGVLGTHRGVAVAQPQRRRAFPRVVEAADLGELVLDAALGDVGQRPAGADRGQLLLVPDQQQLHPGRLAAAVDRDQVRGRRGAGLVDDQQIPAPQPERLVVAAAAAGVEPGLPVEPAADVPRGHAFLGEHVGLALPVGHPEHPRPVLRCPAAPSGGWAAGGR